ncbi:hypothetical protein IEQ34_003877 [Dendrobium chrysotoxum]|uniref:Uncharacterized protein n=1 Tax=Dendrobium chrysotoxum TaxID=161865 RepID=A0AAV7HFQ1_DENCH|nr:hypothetical protein IEQ34_003877 [Dendrobium chrysotoxum]
MARSSHSIVALDVNGPSPRYLRRRIYVFLSMVGSKTTTAGLKIAANIGVLQQMHAPTSRYRKPLQLTTILRKGALILLDLKACIIRCRSCRLKRVALDYYVKDYRRSFHVPYAYQILECHRDTRNYLVLCPVHASGRLPCDKLKKKI